MGKRINTLNTASSPANDDYLPIDGATNGTRKISADFINNLITDVEVDGTSVVTSGVAEIDLSGKQDTLTAGSNITIAQDGTISATDTTYTAGTNVDITGGVISATDTTYTAGANVTIDANNEISATDTTYTAGTNVQINNGVISATDTTYSAFGGATAGADGSSGLVPQPLIADKDKFLKGDGTWDTIQPGASALDDLTNVDITSPTNGQVLKYDSTNQEWVNANESGGGGSTVTITPTLATGTKIADYSIDGVSGALYTPSGGGSGSGYSETTLFTGDYQTTSGEITLSDNLNNYDQIIIWTRWSTTSTNSEVPFVVNRQYFVDTFPYDSGSIAITSPHLLCSLYDTDYLRLKCGSTNNKLFIFDSNNGAVTKVTGIKYGSGGGGGGSGDSFITYSKSVTTTQYGWWVVEDEDGNTLDPDTYVIIDISVNVRYYDVLWYQDSAGDYRATLFDINDGNTVRSSSTRTWTITYAKKDFAVGGSAAISGITPPTSSQGSNGDIYMQYKAGEVSTTIFSGTEHSTAYANPIEISVPNASMYNSFDITCLYYYWSSSPIFDGTDSIDYADLESGQKIFMPSIDDPNTGVVIKLENDTFYIYPSTGYNLYVYEVVGHASTAPTKINHLYGKISNTWVESNNAEEITLPDYNNLTTAQKNDGTIRFIPAGSGGGVTTPYDMSSISSSYVQGEMRLTATSSTETTVEYVSGQQIGCNWNYPTPIDVTNISTIHFKATNGSCYGGGTQAQQSNWSLQIGLTASAIGNQALNITASDSRWAAVADMPLANHVYEESIDVSELTGTYYLLVVAHGWNTVIEDITLDTGGAYPSQIKYMSKTYAKEEEGSALVKLAEYSGSGHGFSEGDTITLSDNMVNYDVLMFATNYSDDVSGWINGLVTVSDFKTKYTGRFYAQYQKDGYTDVKYLTDTTISVLRASGAFINAVYGIKFANGGGSSLVNYSTSENVVGTWIDGSTVYEKVISISNVSLSSGSYETVDTITGLDTIISCNGYVVEGNLKYTLNDITLRVIQDGTSVKLYSPSGTTWTISSGAIIIRYTKTSS